MHRESRNQMAKVVELEMSIHEQNEVIRQSFADIEDLQQALVDSNAERDQSSGIIVELRTALEAVREDLDHHRRSNTKEMAALKTERDILAQRFEKLQHDFTFKQEQLDLLRHTTTETERAAKIEINDLKDKVSGLVTMNEHGVLLCLCVYNFQIISFSPYSLVD